MEGNSDGGPVEEQVDESVAASCIDSPDTLIPGSGFRHSRFYFWKKRLGHYPNFLYWNLRGRPERTPHFLKQRTVKEYARAYGLRTLVEAGTYYGEMVAATRKCFASICSIEWDRRLAALAQSRFALYPHIRVLQGDSELWIPRMLEDIHAPCLFWLDGGYFIWAANKSNPGRLMSELKAILNHSISGHVILLDDARCLNGQNGAPRIEDFLRSIHTDYPDRIVEVRHDIVRITPAN
jgi:hypothetical protein